MSLITCPECQKRISDKSTHCVHCGLPSKFYFTLNKQKKNNYSDNNTKFKQPKKYIVSLYDKVTIKNLDLNKTISISILPIGIEYHPIFKVGSNSYQQEGEYEKRKIYFSNFQIDKTISEDSPLALAILGKGVRDKFEYTAPDGTIRGEILFVKKHETK